MGQQARVSRLLSARPAKPRRVFVNDAGAIPYLSELPAVDGLGLGGMRGLPFARASVHGVPAVLELLQRLEPADRPDVLAIYPGWWPGIERFARRVDAVRISDNVICGADEKLLYEADWSALGPPDVAPPTPLVDVLDVADLVSEREHDFAFSAPRAGYTIFDVLDDGSGHARFDGGRVFNAGAWASFRVRSLERGTASLELVTDPGEAVALSVDVVRADRLSATHEIQSSSREGGRWHTVRETLPDVGAGDTLRLTVARGALTD
jgi:hypothetical protein